MGRESVEGVRDAGKSMDAPSLRINAAIENENAMVITCFPSVGMVSSIVAHYLIDHLDLEFVGGLVDDRLPALALIQQGVPLPPIRAYAGKPQCTIEGCDQVILLMSEMVVPESLVHKIVWSLFEWSKEHKVLAGVVVDAFAKAGMKGGMEGVDPVVEYVDTDDIDVVGIGCNETTRAMLEQMGIPLLETGVIRGMNAGILGEASRRGLGTMSIMVEADPRFPDARAAAAVIERLNALLPMELPQEPLLEEAELLEAQLKSMMESATGGNDSPSSNAMLYG
ncbi:MAG: hypothetical protein CMA86_04585 [Euryarchaeota archaeon]|nr:hypothetical protein [Euryarchaeota archaeon]